MLRAAPPREGLCGSSLPRQGLGEAEGPSGWFLACSPATYGDRPPYLRSQSTDSCLGFRTCQLKTPIPPSMGFVAWLLPGGLGRCGLARPQPRCQPDCPVRQPPSQPSQWPEGAVLAQRIPGLRLLFVSSGECHAEGRLLLDRLSFQNLNLG